jgi:hypothetical protein
VPASTIAAFEDGRVLGREWKLPIFVEVASAFGVFENIFLILRRSDMTLVNHLL